MAKRLKIKLGARSTEDAIELLEKVAASFPAMDHVEIDCSSLHTEEVRNLPAETVAMIREHSSQALEISTTLLTADRGSKVSSPNSLKSKIGSFVKGSLKEGWKCFVEVIVKDKMMGG